MSSEYNADSIQVLSDIQHIRLRSGMYIGEGIDPRQLLYEILDNASDEIQSGYSNRTVISVDTHTNEYRVRDYGRGLPHGTKVLEDGRELGVIEILFTIAKSGGKFNNDNYRLSSGLHGVGATVTNALSSKLTATSYRDGKYVSYEFIDGDVSNISSGDTDQPNGSEVSFIPDEKYFRNNTIPIELIISKCKIINALVGGSTELIIDGSEIDTKSDAFDLMYEDDNNCSELCRSSFRVIDEDTGESALVAIKYVNETDSHYSGFTNLTHNTSGGTHHRMMDRCISNAWSHFNIEGINPNDVFIGSRVVIAVFLTETEYSSQTKEKLTVDKSKLAKLEQMITDALIKWLESEDDIRKGLITRFQEYRSSKNKLLAKKEIKDLIYINDAKDSSSIRRKSVVSKLVECSSKQFEGTELFICEGDSAQGSILASRNPRTQAVIPVRGKVLNVSKMGDIKQCVNNEEVRSIANAAGTGILDDCDASKSRYSKYIIEADADKDGYHITALLIGLFVNVLPDVVKKGLLYISHPPLYGWKEKGQYRFTNDKSSIPEGIPYTRYKGLGEMDPDEMGYVLVNPETRNPLTQINYPEDLGLFNQILTSPSYKYEMLYELGLITYNN